MGPLIRVMGISSRSGCSFTLNFKHTVVNQTNSVVWGRISLKQNCLLHLWNQKWTFGKSMVKCTLVYEVTHINEWQREALLVV